MADLVGWILGMPLSAEQELQAKCMLFFQKLNRPKSTPVHDIRELRPGDHICYPTVFGRIAYHHAIVLRVIDSQTVEVIDFNAPESGGKMNQKSDAVVKKNKVDLSQFRDDGTLFREDYYVICLPADEVVKRAKSKYGKTGAKDGGYYLATNNCEHFATWCKTGYAYSVQTGM